MGRMRENADGWEDVDFECCRVLNMLLFPGAVRLSGPLGPLGPLGPFWPLGPLGPIELPGLRAGFGLFLLQEGASVLGAAGGFVFLTPVLVELHAILDGD